MQTFEPKHSIKNLQSTITSVMKKTIIFSLIALIFAACSAGGGDDLASKKAQLATYQTQMDELKSKMTALEAEIAKMSEGVEQREIAKAVAVETLKASPFAHYIEVRGNVEAKQSQSVNAGMPGQLRRVLVEEGQQVSRGQLLAEIDASSMQESIKQMEINIAAAKTVYERQQKLWDQKIGSEIQLIQAKSSYESLVQQLASMKEQFKYAKITAPVGGTVDIVYLKTGQSVAPGMPVVNIVNTAELRAVGKVPDSYSSQVREGMAVKIILPDLGDTISSKVTLVSKAINQSSRTFTVESALPSRTNVKPNLYAILSINDQNVANTLVVSQNIIQSDEKGKFVLIAAQKDGKLRAVKRYVETGLSYNGKVQVTSGLQAGDQVISMGYQTVADGQLLVLE